MVVSLEAQVTSDAQREAKSDAAADELVSAEVKLANEKQALQDGPLFDLEGLEVSAEQLQQFNTLNAMLAASVQDAVRAHFGPGADAPRAQREQLEELKALRTSFKKRGARFIYSAWAQAVNVHDEMAQREMVCSMRVILFQEHKLRAPISIEVESTTLDRRDLLDGEALASVWGKTCECAERELVGVLGFKLERRIEAGCAGLRRDLGERAAFVRSQLDRLRRFGLQGEALGGQALEIMGLQRRAVAAAQFIGFNLMTYGFALFAPLMPDFKNNVSKKAA
ncbi:unnamed protein product [Prorocentrum cordatum]|uniref:Uncharacterized protein n=1 Tax=Prorocentrum cordatum TaxID=2364126 RepID=A0ABN9VBY3_9DINO|nr:unnamed protein product [Polarella glacialis]